jgi:hypothetical protein
MELLKDPDGPSLNRSALKGDGLVAEKRASEKVACDMVATSRSGARGEQEARPSYLVSAAADEDSRVSLSRRVYENGSGWGWRFSDFSYWRYKDAEAVP